jgi:hypothetical protein
MMIPPRRIGIALGFFLVAMAQGMADTRAFLPAILPLFAGGFLLFGWACLKKTAETGLSLPRWLEGICLGFIFLLAVFFRFFRLDEIPPGFNHDTAMHCEYAIRFLRGYVSLQPYYVPPSHHPIGYETLQPLTIWLYMKWLGVVPLAAKLAAATTGMLAVVLVYFFSRRFYGIPIALASTLFLAVCGWHFVFSRVGWHCITVPLWETAALFAFWSAARSSRTSLFALAGAVAAVNLATYSISRLLLFKLFLLYLYWNWRGEVSWKKQWRQGAVFLLSFIAAAIPIFVYAFENWDAFQGRTRALLVANQPLSDAIAGFARNLWATLLNFNYRGNGDDFIVDRPLLDAPISVFFVLGLALALVRFRESRWGTLLLWWLASLLPGLLSSPNPNHNIAALVPAVLLAGSGAVFCLDALADAFSKNRRRWAAATAALLLAGGTVLYHYSLYLHSSTRRPLWGLYPETRIVGAHLNNLLPDHAAYVANNYPVDILTFMTDNGGDFIPRFTHLWNQPEKILSIPPSDWDGKGMVFIAKPSPENEPVFSALKTLYPAGRLFDLANDSNAGGEKWAARVFQVEKPSLPQNPHPTPKLLQAPSTLWEMKNILNGSNDGKESEWMGLAVGLKGNLYASDLRNHRIVHIDRSGKRIRSWGGFGDKAGSFNEPRGLACDAQGNLYVVDSWNHRLQQFDAEGRFKAEWKGSGWFGPKDAAVAQDRLYVADTGNSRIEILDKNGKSRGIFGQPGNGPGEFNSPSSLCMGPHESFYILDSGNARIQRWNLDGTFRDAWPIPGWTPGHLVEAFLRFHKDTLILSSPQLGQILRFSPEGVPLDFLACEGNPTGIACDGRKIFVGLRKAEAIRIFNLR